MREFPIYDEVDCFPDRYWSLTFDPGFCHAFFVDELHYESFHVREDRYLPDGSRERVTEGTPPARLAPSWARGKLAYVQRSRLHLDVLTFSTHSVSFPRLVTVEGSMRFRLNPSSLASLHVKPCVRVAAVRVSLHFAGSALEPIVERKVRDSFAASARYMNAYLRREREAKDAVRRATRA